MSKLPKSGFARLRLAHQRLDGDPAESAEDAVRWLGAVQSQDYHDAKWSIGQRCRSLTGSEFDACFNSGRVLRTHVLRPTWHFVPPEDLGWMQRLTSPRVHALNAAYYRKEGIDAAVVKRGRKLVERQLRRNQHCTRHELAAIFARNALPSTGLGLAYLVMHLELDGVICSGPLRGRQFTYALLEERVPNASHLQGDDALRELAFRYFRSHAPATIHDFAWWSGATVATARHAVALNQERLSSELRTGKEYWFHSGGTAARAKAPLVHLVSIYDEHVLAYADRSHVTHPDAQAALASRADALNLLILLDGRAIGSWTRTIKSRRIEICCTSFIPLGNAATQALQQAGARYGAFWDSEVSLAIERSPP